MNNNFGLFRTIITSLGGNMPTVKAEPNQPRIKVWAEPYKPELKHRRRKYYFNHGSAMRVEPRAFGHLSSRQRKKAKLVQRMMNNPMWGVHKAKA